MSKRVFVLQVGVNDYAPEVGKLSGCLNDVQHFRDFLTDTYDKKTLFIETLTDADATRDNIIKQFRTHLGRAGKDDVVLFQYCGHGAQWASAPEFAKFYPDGKDEGLVCYDSRREGGSYPYDLADKELGTLLAEVAKKDPHIAVILDCCHSGSGTRNVDSINHMKPRQTHEVSDVRPLESYLDGYFQQMRKKGDNLYIPGSRHVLMAACERFQKAWETRDRRGLFTTSLLTALQDGGHLLSYADLFVRTRAVVQRQADNQLPQFETYAYFNAANGFLGAVSSGRGTRYSVYYEEGGWHLNAGGIHGLPTETDKVTTLTLYSDDAPDKVAGVAETASVGAQKSDITPQFEAKKTVRYQAEVSSIPIPPTSVHLSGDKSACAVMTKALDPSVPAVFVTDGAGTDYQISAEKGGFYLRRSGQEDFIQGIKGTTAESATRLVTTLKHILRWERTRGLQNKSTQLDTAKVEFHYAEMLPAGKTRVHKGHEIDLDFVKDGDDWREVRGEATVINNTDQTLHCALLYFSESFGVHVLRNEPVKEGGSMVLWGEGPDDYIYLEDGVNHSSELFRLFVSTEKVDDFLLTQEDIEVGEMVAPTRAIGNVKPRKKMVHKNEWFTVPMQLNVIRQLDEVSAKGAKLANGKISIKGHSSLKAKLSLASAASGRSVGGGFAMADILDRAGLEMVNFSGTRGDAEAVLELEGIENAAALAGEPLEIELDMPLGEDEDLSALTFDGEHIVLVGESSRGADGKPQISIGEIPDTQGSSRSLGKSLKLYFYKTYLKRENVNRLCWIEYLEDGTPVHHKSGVADKVNAAKNIIMLVHGIIGDTESIAPGLHLAEVGGKRLHEHFDLVLTYDYENLSTPLPETAAMLKQQLEAVGIGPNDDKKLTILAHSMGGLVSRWFIEQGGGNTFVDHLVMCGTPNNGSPFGRVETARKIMTMLTTLALNYVPGVAPALVFLLRRTKKITPTLEQMNAKSNFMTTLNTSSDPGIRYTILAGDVEEYREPNDEFFPKLLAKTGKSLAFEALFGGAAHDIAVSVESILGVSSERNPSPKRNNVPCHHMNYFNSETGLKALMEVEW